MPAALMAAADDPGPDWSALPAGVLRHVMGLASTWQLPGCCMAAPVCRSWRSAADGCSNIRLLYFLGDPTADASFAAWLARRGRHLQALTISYSHFASIGSAWSMGDTVFTALVDTAVAAAAAGTPWRLQALRLVACSLPLDQFSQLLSALPRLRILRCGLYEAASPMRVICSADDEAEEDAESAAQYMDHLAPLHQATQLQELHLVEVSNGPASSKALAGLLPPSLQRLRWSPDELELTGVPDLSHHQQLTALHLDGWLRGSLDSSKVPPHLRDLALDLDLDVEAPLFWEEHVEPADHEEQVFQQHQVLTLLNCSGLTAKSCHQLTTCTWLGSLTISSRQLQQQQEDVNLLAQLTGLDTLTLSFFSWDDVENHSGKIMSAAAGLSRLRRLDLRVGCSSQAFIELVPKLTGLSHLMLMDRSAERDTATQQAWRPQLGSMAGLRALSVAEDLAVLDHSWLPGLQQLRVLRLQVCWRYRGWESPVLEWLAERPPQELPPHLQVLCLAVHGNVKMQSSQMYPLLRRRLASRGCELVVHTRLDADECGAPFWAAHGCSRSRWQLAYDALHQFLKARASGLCALTVAGFTGWRDGGPASSWSVPRSCSWLLRLGSSLMRR